MKRVGLVLILCLIGCETQPAIDCPIKTIVASAACEDHPPASMDQYGRLLYVCKECPDKFCKYMACSHYAKLGSSIACKCMNEEETNKYKENYPWDYLKKDS